MEQYMKALKSYKRMPGALEDLIREKVKPVTFTNGTIIQKKGVLCNRIYFIEKGVVRIYDSKKVIQFKKENEFIISYFLGEELKRDVPGIQALEDITAWEFTPEMVEDTSSHFPEFGLHLTIMMMKDAEVINKINSCMRDSDSASALYDYLRGHAPDLLDRVSPEHLASFLGISQKVFSHMKGNNIRTAMSGKHLRRGLS